MSLPELSNIFFLPWGIGMVFEAIIDRPVLGYLVVPLTAVEFALIWLKAYPRAIKISSWGYVNATVFYLATNIVCNVIATVYLVAMLSRAAPG